MNSTANTANQPPREEFVRLLMRYERVIRAFLRPLLPSQNDVDEVMQEFSVVAWRKFESLDHTDNFCKWGCGIARIEVLRYKRTKARDRLVLGAEVEQLLVEEGIEELELRRSQLSALEVCVEKLPSQKKQIVLDSYAGERSIKEIAEETGKKPDAFYQILSRLRRQLLKCVERKLSEANG